MNNLAFVADAQTNCNCYEIGILPNLTCFLLAWVLRRDLVMFLETL